MTIIPPKYLEYQNIFPIFATISIAIWQTKKVYKSKVKMQTTSAPMAWLLLQENEQAQYLQKIAQMRKKSIRPQI